MAYKSLPQFNRGLRNQAYKSFMDLFSLSNKNKKQNKKTNTKKKQKKKKKKNQCIFYSGSAFQHKAMPILFANGMDDKSVPGSLQGWQGYQL